MRPVSRSEISLVDAANQPVTQIASIVTVGSPCVVRLYNGQTVEAIVPKNAARDIYHLSVNDVEMVRLGESLPHQIASRVSCRYFKRYWDEDCGSGACDGWGPSTFYFESGPDGWVFRQLQLFDDGRLLAYDTDRCDDEYGGLSEAALSDGERPRRTSVLVEISPRRLTVVNVVRWRGKEARNTFSFTLVARSRFALYASSWFAASFSRSLPVTCTDVGLRGSRWSIVPPWPLDFTLYLYSSRDFDVEAAYRSFTNTRHPTMCGH